MLERFDLLKAYPVHGWQAVLGELLCPITILCVFEWLFLTLLALAISLSIDSADVTPLSVDRFEKGALIHETMVL